jgi:hypothetical protein
MPYVRESAWAEVLVELDKAHEASATIRELVEALEVARNRLQMAAINAAASGDQVHFMYGEWAVEADAALSKVKPLSSGEVRP